MSLALRHATRSRPGSRKIARIITSRLYSTQNEHQGQTSTSRWAPAHKPGEHLLYDMALRVIEDDSKRLLARMEQLSREDPAQKEKLEELEVLSEMNKPEVLWAVKNDKGRFDNYFRLAKLKTSAGDMSKPVYRHLAKRQWREQGKLDHLVSCFVLFLSFR